MKKSTTTVSNAILATSILSSCCCTTPMGVAAFTPSVTVTSCTQQRSRGTTSAGGVGRPLYPLHATMTADELSTMSKDDQFKILGVEEEKLALGIEPDEVLEFIGTREDLIAKFQTDIPNLSNVESEVDKFLMDGEMLDLNIKYTQRKREDPNWEPQYAGEQDTGPLASVMNFASQYAFWIIGGILLKDTVTNFMGKNAAGGGEGVGDVLVSSALDGIHHVSNTMG